MHALDVGRSGEMTKVMPTPVARELRWLAAGARPPAAVAGADSGAEQLLEIVLRRWLAAQRLSGPPERAAELARIRELARELETQA